MTNFFHYFLSHQASEILLPLLLLSIGFGVSFFLTPFSIRLSLRYKIVDNPGGRKLHDSPTPKGGGLALWGTFVVYVLLLKEKVLFFDVLFFSGATITFFVGYGDGIFPIPPGVRLVTHLFAASLVVLSQGFSPLLSVIVVLWLAGCTSAYNNVDGINGLCLSLGGTSFLVAFFFAPFPVWLYSLGMCLGVFLWNFPKAQTFLGDGGSNFIGYVWACLGLHYFALNQRLSLFSLWQTLFILALIGGLPVFDTLYSALRRILQKKSPFSPDRGHFHYLLYDRGLPLWFVLGVLVSVHGICVFSGLSWLYSKVG